METSAIENRKTEREIFNNFRISKNIPIDSRFIVNSLLTINTELPLSIRYDGLIFFVEESEINGNIGNHYYFGKDLTTPIPLLQAIIAGIVQQVTVLEINYGNLNNILNATNSVAGNIVTVKPLDITFIFDGLNWKYFAGKYLVATDDNFISLPNNLKEPGEIVKIGTVSFIEKIINLDLTLSLVLSNRFNIFTVNLMKGKNRINHQFSSTYIFSFMRIYDIINPQESNNKIIPTPFEIVDSMNIDVLCSFDNVTADILIQANKIL